MPAPAPGARYMSSLLPLTPIGCGAAVLMSVHGRQQSDVMPVTLCEVIVVILVARRYAGRGAGLVQPAVLPSQGSGRCAFEYAECLRGEMCRHHVIRGRPRRRTHSRCRAKLENAPQ